MDVWDDSILLAILNSAAMNIYVHVFVCTNVFNVLAYIHGGIAGSYGKSV